MSRALSRTRTPNRDASGAFLVFAATPNGGRRLGMHRARDRRQLAEHLRRDRLVPIRTWSLPSWAGSDDRVRLKDQAELHLQLSQLLVRGVPLVEALDVTSTAVAPRTKPRVERMRDLVAAGSSFSDACEQVSIFDRVTVSVYRAAERTGDLAGAAKQLAMTARRQLAISGKVGTLLIYPAIVLTISVIVTVGMLTMIVPRIGKALEGAGVELPLFTKMMVVTGVFLTDHWVASVLVVLALVTFAVFSRDAIARIIGRASRNIPILKDVVLAQESARFFTVMAAMTRSGITLSEALGTAVSAIGHPLMKKQLTTLRTKLVEGGVLRNLIDRVDALPVPTRRLLIAAERAGDLESAFETLAQDMADELDRRSSRLLAALEPLLIVMMFLMIGTLLLSIMIPLMKLSGQQLG
ncbi:MAG: type II secretion system F family protein [bacterium]|nr:type II secretion system F family protein [bacterium]